MKTKREAHPELMAQWLQAWTTLGRWQALNSRLSKHGTRRTPLGATLLADLRQARGSRGRFDPAFHDGMSA